MVLGRIAQFRAQVDQVGGERTWPDHVDHQDVEVGRLSLEETLILGKCVRRALRPRDHVNLDTRILLKALRGRLVEVVANADAIPVVDDRRAGERLVGVLDRRRVTRAELTSGRGR
ncbi:MAG: hypothetical protein E6I75_08905 [Chloroflexi bacterium]|nr:MAG: hypothetical protein E6I75_08905 [Chloroflexota bacterium]